MILIGQSIQSISPTISEAVEHRNPGPLRDLAISQADAGADYLDINLSSIMKETVSAMEWAVDTVQDAVDLPLLINTTNPAAMEAGIKQCKRRPVINSANGMKEGKEKILPLAAKYPADVVIGTYDEQGAPPTADERAMLALGLVEYANELGISTENIWIDPAVYPICTNQDQVVACIEFLEMIEDVIPGTKTITGVSNVSSGEMPAIMKRVLNRSFLVIAERYQQHAAIVNVFDKALVKFNKGELPETRQLIHRAMDERDLDLTGLSRQDAAYVKATHFLLGKEPYSKAALQF